jgi:hypothetical protein
MATQTSDVVASLGLERFSALVAQESFVDARRVATPVAASLSMAGSR